MWGEEKQNRIEYKEMKIVSDRLKRVLDFSGHRCVRVLTQKRHLKPRILKRIMSEYEEELNLCGQMFRLADDHDFSLFLDPHDPRWKEVGFDNFCDDEFIFIRRLCEKDGYHVAFTSNGLVVPPKSRETKLFLVSFA